MSAVSYNYLVKLELIGRECLLPHDITIRVDLNQFGGSVSFRGGRRRDKVDVH